MVKTDVSENISMKSAVSWDDRLLVTANIVSSSPILVTR
jgi:hypothetical protein